VRNLLAWLTAALSLACAQLSAASQCLPNRPAVTVQIRDYAHVKPKSLSKATEIAGRMYKRAGIGIEWLGVASQDVAGPREAPAAEKAPHPIAQLTIDIVTSSMAKRNGYAGDVVGYVSVPPEGGMGRIGYVIYDRIKDVAAGGLASTSDVLGIIIAHDVGRLILGAGSGTFSGIMTRMWDRDALQRVNPMSLSFTPPEVERLRAALDRDSGSVAVGTSGSVPEECIASRDDTDAKTSRTPSPAPPSSPGR
jgi:hypothetical protein